MKKVMIATSLIFLFAISFARNSYIGYSGAPGSRGTCSVTCHYRQHFDPSIVISGFPETYEPEHQYVITVYHTGDALISQFNASIRIGTGSSNGGHIYSGENTMTYSHPQETNGVKWSSNYCDSGTFVWFAPEPGTGEVNLYWAGLQGTLGYGASYHTILSSNEATTDVKNTHLLPEDILMARNYPNPFNNETIIRIQTENAGNFDLEILNLLGQQVFDYSRSISGPGVVNIVWDGRDSDSNNLPSGIYFYRLRTQSGSITNKMLLLR
jgi:hypothetical protein